jgi:hypothetical protein
MSTFSITTHQYSTDCYFIMNFPRLAPPFSLNLSINNYVLSFLILNDIFSVLNVSIEFSHELLLHSTENCKLCLALLCQIYFHSKQKEYRKYQSSFYRPPTPLLHISFFLLSTLLTVLKWGDFRHFSSFKDILSIYGSLCILYSEIFTYLLYCKVRSGFSDQYVLPAIKCKLSKN